MPAPDVAELHVMNVLTVGLSWSRAIWIDHDVRSLESATQAICVSSTQTGGTVAWELDGPAPPSGLTNAGPNTRKSDPSTPIVAVERPAAVSRKYATRCPVDERRTFRGTP